MIRINNLLPICCLIVKPTETSTKNNYPHLDKVEKEDKEDREAKGDKVARTMTMMMTISSTEILMMVE